METKKLFKDCYLPSDFEALAHQLLNESVLIVNSGATTTTTLPTKHYRLCEIEMYYKNRSDHNDEYVHGHQDQLKHAHFYFHRYHNGTYKAGTYKGMDITFGNENVYFGVLVRSIEDLDTGEFTEGPCRVVNKLLESFQVNNVKELFATHFPSLQQISVDNPRLQLSSGVTTASQSPILSTLTEEKVYRGPRIGLSDKFPLFKNRPYRFAIKIKKIRKERNTLVEC
jgi:3-methyladenine DNA glycosylase Mpg